MKKYSHIVFDVDGTLIDNEKVILASLQKAIEQTDGRSIEPDDLRFALGIPGMDALVKLNVSDPAAVHTLWEQINMRHAAETRLFDGIYETVAALSKKGYILGIITSRTREELLDEVVRRFAPIIPYFGLQVCADDTQLHKPNAEPLLFYMDRTGVAPCNILYIGDSIHDYHCAQNAGVDFGLVGWGCAPGDEIKRHARYCFNKPSEIELL